VAVAALVALALALGACSVVAEVGSRTWGVSMTNQAGESTSVKVTDASGRVTDIELDPEDADLFGGVAVAAGHPGTLDVPWTGGGCDVTTSIDISGRGAGLAVKVGITTGDQPCDGMGVPHVVRLTLAQPVAPGLVTVSQ
jgi:hypothetical protein